MNNNHHGGGFINGFLWGAIIGAVVVFLLGTKKGKNILKLISEESFELSELFDEEEDQPVQKHEKCAHCKEKVDHHQSETAEVQSGSEAPQKRFFRNIPKKS